MIHNGGGRIPARGIFERVASRMLNWACNRIGAAHVFELMPGFKDGEKGAEADEAADINNPNYCSSGGGKEGRV